MSEPTRLFRVPTLSRSLVLERTWPFFLDLSVAACGLALFYAVLRIAEYWMGHPVPAIEISRSAKMLPLYAFYSMVRITVAYLLSLTFAVGYGYIAAYTPAGRSLHDRGAGYSAIDSGAEFFTGGDAGHDLA